MRQYSTLLKTQKNSQKETRGDKTSLLYMYNIFDPKSFASVSFYNYDHVFMIKFCHIFILWLIHGNLFPPTSGYSISSQEPTICHEEDDNGSGLNGSWNLLMTLVEEIPCYNTNKTGTVNVGWGQQMTDIRKAVERKEMEMRTWEMTKSGRLKYIQMSYFDRYLS